MRLVPVKPDLAVHIRILYDLLEERDPRQSISHKKMPKMSEHMAFVASQPYLAWYLICVDTFVGACYITRQHELGIGIFKAHRANGYAEAALKMLMEKHPGRHLSNINPQNEASLQLFAKLGFTGPIQVTLSKEI